MLKTMLFVSVAVLGFGTATFAGEGNGDPFPGPDAAVVTTMGANPKYTMGADAPFNYFGTATPTQMTGYQRAPGAMDDPYPFKMNGQVIRVAPSPQGTVAASPYPSNHG